MRTENALTAGFVWESIKASTIHDRDKLTKNLFRKRDFVARKGVSGIYMLTHHNMPGYTKIGITSHLSTRVKAIRSQMYRPNTDTKKHEPQVQIFIETPNALVLEQAMLYILRQNLKEHDQYGEWFYGEWLVLLGATTTVKGDLE